MKQPEDMKTITSKDVHATSRTDEARECQFCNKKAVLNKRFKPTPEYPLAYDLCDSCAKEHKEAYLSLGVKTIPLVRKSRTTEDMKTRELRNKRTKEWVKEFKVLHESVRLSPLIMGAFISKIEDTTRKEDRQVIEYLNTRVSKLLDRLTKLGAKIKDTTRTKTLREVEEGFVVSENMIMWAFRYALGRRTGAVDSIAGITKPPTVMLSQKKIGEKIRRLRKERGLSQDELGKQLNKTHASISDIELGKTNLSLERLRQIAVFFDMTVSGFLEEKGQASPQQNFRVGKDMSEAEREAIIKSLDQFKKWLR